MDLRGAGEIGGKERSVKSGEETGGREEGERAAEVWQGRKLVLRRGLEAAKRVEDDRGRLDGRRGGGCEAGLAFRERETR